MGKDFIGKRVRVTIGNSPPPKDDNAIIGSDTDIHITPEQAAQYDNIVGEKIEMTIGGDPNPIVSQVIDAISDTNEVKREEIIAICNEILNEDNEESKMNKIGALISIGAGITSIAQFCMQLKTILRI